MPKSRKTSSLKLLAAVENWICDPNLANSATLLGAITLYRQATRVGLQPIADDMLAMFERLARERVAMLSTDAVRSLPIEQIRSLP